MALCWDQIITDELDVDERSRIVDRIKDAVKDIKDDRAVKGKQLAAIKDFQRLCVCNEEDSYKEAESITEQFCQDVICEEKIINSSNVIIEFSNCLKMYNRKVSLLSAIFSYAERNFVSNENVQHLKVPIDQPKEKIGINKIVIKVWLTIVNNVKDALSEGILRFIESERRATSDADENTEARAIKDIIDSINKLEAMENDDKSKINKLYSTVIEQPIIKQVEEYYKTKSVDNFKSMSFSDYLLMCNDILKKEEKLMTHNFPRSSALIIQIVWKKLVYDHLNLIVEGTINYIKCEEFENVKIAYTSLKYSPEAMKEINTEIETRVEQIFSKLRETCDATSFCDRFMITFSEEQALLKSVFDSNPGSVAALDKGISKALNMNFDGGDKPARLKSAAVISRVPDTVVSYLDQLMKSGTKGLNETETEKKLDDIITIFQYIEDKDVFIQLYAKRLSMRLIHSSSQSKEAEEMMVNKMKIKCGNQFVAKIEKMLTDVELSKEMTSKFNDIKTLPISFSVLVTQTGSWPIQAFKSALAVPKDLTDVLSSFNKYYSENYSGRKLLWHHGLSTCDIKLNYLSKSCIVQTTVTVTAILSQFNSVESATFEELRVLTDIDKKILLKLLQFLSTQNILSSDGNNVTEESTFSLNCKYESKRARVKLIPVLREATEETNQTTKAVMEERKFYLQALIVRIMKAKKSLPHKDLLNEVIQESISNFIPSQVFIKSVIDGLIEKEYLAKAEGECDVYNYLA